MGKKGMEWAMGKKVKEWAMGKKGMEWAMGKKVMEWAMGKKEMEWAMGKKGISQIWVRSVMSLYEGAKTRVRVDSVLSEELEVKVEMHQGSVLPPFLFAVVVDVVTEFAREGAR